ncbi:hypothetical protein ACFQWA_11825 [Streptomyces thermogriseus]|uniref:Uncharacterized protein n=1 Tax=Streptomyces thermogriseus TaxID=75292 RepID=A0ABN1SXP1_9ACTN
MTAPEPPSALDLTYAQHAGWACCWCGKSLLGCGGVEVGIARGSLGVHVLDVQVYACPDCASRPPSQAPAPAGERKDPGRGGATPAHATRQPTLPAASRIGAPPHTT